MDNNTCLYLSAGAILGWLAGFFAAFLLLNLSAAFIVGTAFAYISEAVLERAAENELLSLLKTTKNQWKQTEIGMILGFITMELIMVSILSKTFMPGKAEFLTAMSVAGIFFYKLFFLFARKMKITKARTY